MPRRSAADPRIRSIGTRQLPDAIARYSTRDDAGLADALPRQTEHECVELRAGQRHEVRPLPWARRTCRWLSRRAASHTPMPSCTSTFMRLARRLANRYAWWGRAAPKTSHHAGQRRLGAGTHVQRLDRQPHRVDTDHRSSSRIQAAKSAAADSGQVIVIVVAPRRSSIWMSRAFAGGDDRRQRHRHELTGERRSSAPSLACQLAASGARRWR